MTVMDRNYWCCFGFYVHILQMAGCSAEQGVGSLLPALTVTTTAVEN